ncbi:peptide chain release factor N(5)-glutamine methyltransferase [Chiayiivirga flava]|uniref:Release factor glutamine methyltransferase n=1 Tax=Chiayiivirga flava TaxID=659595 RepID=A0A7W8DA91_9GAMM|nr:peptide chain release factor N(5)-glutamine methyltransferase [Chiayiivirga flava]MBB5209013.1 release factor glutamine methyltransferase [Chiayiivirga flava]
MPESSPTPALSTVAALLAHGAARLAHCDSRRDAELLLEHVLGRDRAWLFAHAGDTVDAAAAAGFDDLVAQRVRGVPIAHLTGTRGFWTLQLRVTPDTLIPRPETELLVELALACLPADAPARIADLGTGSGAIALALACERPRASVVATDASAAALGVARDNAAGNGIDTVEFRHGDWFAPLAGERFDLIASNPPYIAAGDPHLWQGDLRFEPLSALASGHDGLDAIRRIVAEAPRFLRPGGWLLLEHGFDQGASVRALFDAAGFASCDTRQDLERRDRVTLGRVAR